MPKITEMFAFVMADKDENDEGVPAFFDRTTGSWMPLVGADRNRISSLEEVAQRIANEHKKEIRLIRFTWSETIKVIKPQ
jgi:hypothetical protein